MSGTSRRVTVGRAKAASAVVAVLVAAGLNLTLSGRESAAAACQTSTASSGLYTVLVCVTQPSSGSTIVGDTVVTATVKRDGRHESRRCQDGVVPGRPATAHALPVSAPVHPLHRRLRRR